MNALHSPKAVDLAERLALIDAYAKMSCSELDRLSALAAGHGRALALCSLVCFFACLWPLATAKISGVDVAFISSAIILGVVLFFLSLSTGMSKRRFGRLEDEIDVSKALALIESCREAREWRDEAARSGRFLRGFDLRAMELIAEIQTAESRFMDLNSSSEA